MKAILALDAGTTNVKAILVDAQANVLARRSVPLSIHFPQSGWVEQFAHDVWEAARQALEGCLVQSGGREAVAWSLDISEASTCAPTAPRFVFACGAGLPDRLGGLR